MANSFPHYRQLHSRDCGAVCLKMVAEYHGREYALEQIKAIASQQKEGVSLLDISKAAEEMGMHVVGAKLPFSRLVDDIPLPGIAHWKEKHFVVVVDANEKGVTIADPDKEGVLTISVPEFLAGWTGRPQEPDTEGVILLLEPTADFYTKEGRSVEKRSMKHFWQTAFKDTRLLVMLGVTVAIGLLLKTTFPFLLQMTVDESVGRENPALLTVVLGVWLLLYVCLMGLDAVRRFLLFHLGTKVNIRLLTDLMKKLVGLPARFYQNRMTDDVIQMLYDSPRLQRFFIQDAVPMMAATLQLLLYAIVLLAFDLTVFAVFLGVSILQAVAVRFFVKKQKLLNYRRQELSSDHYGKLVDLFRGIQDVKISNAETQQRWVWERSEAKIHELARRFALSNGMAMQIPFHLGEIRNVVIIVISALAVIDKSMSIGVLVAIVFILTQLNNPLRDIIQFLVGWQETRMSLARMNEIHNLDAERQEIQVDVVPENAPLVGENISFQYPGSQSQLVLSHLDFRIPFGKTTLILGTNGSGKSTLIDLLLHFLQPNEGLVKLGDLNLNEMNNAAWLSACGVVRQDGHIFHTSIARNIALGDEVIDSTKLLRAARIANLFDFLDRLKDGFSTIIGEGGTGLSKGQRQRVLIARAVYTDPDYLFLDEATNDLDSENERIVLSRIEKAFRGKTIVIAASRMSENFRADNIIPLAVPRMGRESQGELSSVRGASELPSGESNHGVFENHHDLEDHHDLNLNKTKIYGRHQS